MKFYWEEICWKEAVAKLNTIPGGELQYSAPIYPSISTNSPFPLTPKDQPDQTQAGAWWSVRELGKDPEQDQKKDRDQEGDQDRLNQHLKQNRKTPSPSGSQSPSPPPPREPGVFPARADGQTTSFRLGKAEGLISRYL
jgi:hypothetical protein